MGTPILKPDEEQFIRDNYASMSVPTMAKKMHRASSSIYPWMEINGLKPFSLDRRARDHPFRKANRALEATVIQRKIDNRKANPK